MPMMDSQRIGGLTPVMIGPRLKTLILGGTSEARALAEAILHHPEIDAVMSLAGRTAEPLRQVLPVRIGGFGGADGLQDHIRRHGIDAVIDATHPYAARISSNAAKACERNTPLLRLERAAWAQEAGDSWQIADNAAHAAEILGDGGEMAFLAMGRLEMQPFLRLQRPSLIRTVDPLPPGSIPANWRSIAATGPFDLAAELALFKEHGIRVLVSKNSGGTAAYAKIAAARELGLTVVIIQRPPLPDTQTAQTITDVIRWLLERHRGKTPTERAV
jgi:precorrin-6A/cobalt-precorrin-6A reductase